MGRDGPVSGAVPGYWQPYPEPLRCTLTAALMCAQMLERKPVKIKYRLVVNTARVKFWLAPQPVSRHLKRSRSSHSSPHNEEAHLLPDRRGISQD